MARGHDGLMSCFHRILQGHNHDTILLKSDASRTETHGRRGGGGDKSASSRSRRDESRPPTPRSSSSSENARGADAEPKLQMICTDHVNKGFQTETHNCNVLWINSRLEQRLDRNRATFLEVTQSRRHNRVDPALLTHTGIPTVSAVRQPKKSVSVLKHASKKLPKPLTPIQRVWHPGAWMVKRIKGDLRFT